VSCCVGAACTAPAGASEVRGLTVLPPLICSTPCISRQSFAANWFETKINKDTGVQGPYRYEKFSYPALAFTPQSQPRIAADGVSLQDAFYLYYLACDSHCEAETNWTSTPLYDRGSGANVSYDVEAVARVSSALAGGAGDPCHAAVTGRSLPPGSWRCPEAVQQTCCQVGDAPPGRRPAGLKLPGLEHRPYQAAIHQNGGTRDITGFT